MNKQQLASKIWAGANELRGKVSASAYKDYMLGFIFYKYLSDKEEKYLKEKMYFDEDSLVELTEEDIETLINCQNNLGYFICYDNLFSSWIRKGLDYQIKDVRTALSAFNRLIGVNYKKVYNGIFDTLEDGIDSLGTGDPERTKNSRSLINLINDIPMDGNQDYDVLGFIYEFLLKNFAANAGKAGEFYTPYEASLVMSEIIANHLKDREEISIYDPTSGSGSLLINIGKSVSKHLKKANSIKYYAQELIENSYNLTRMNLIMRDVLPDNIIVRNGDTLADDWPFFDEADKEKTYDPVWVDGCCSNPPYSQSWVNADAGYDPRFKDYGIAPKSKADYAFLLHNLYHLKSDGIMTIVLPHGVLFRSGEEASIREKLIEKNNIETIIGLPANIFFGTSIPTIIMVLKKTRNESDVLFIDASKGFIKEGTKNRLQAKDVKKIVDTVIRRNPSEKDKKFARLVTKKEIVEKNEYNLNISRYVDSNTDLCEHDIYASMFGGLPNNEINKYSKYWECFPTLKSKLFSTINESYSINKSEDLRKIIYENKDVLRFKESYKLALADYPLLLENDLVNNCDNVDVLNEENYLSNKLYEMFKNIKLVDFYDAYQILDTNWNAISLDLEIIKTDGKSAITKVDPNIVTKKNSKTKEITEYQDGWVGHILPFDLIQEYYFKDRLNSLNGLKNELSDLEFEKNELLDSIDPIDKSELIKDDGETIESKKLNAVISKLKKELKKGAEFEENSYEDIVLKVNDINNKMKSLKKIIKTDSEILEEKTKYTIENLSKKDSLKMLSHKWIDPIIIQLNDLSNIVIESFSNNIDNLVCKYSLTYKDIINNIESSKENICSMIEDLVGNEYDIKGLNEFKKIIGGDSHE